MNAFFYSFVNMFQPGIFWPSLAAYKPMMIISIVAGLSAMGGAYVNRSQQFGSKPFKYMLIYIFIQVLSMYYAGFSAMLSEFDTWYIYAIYVCIILLLVKDEASLNKVVWGLICGGMFIVGFGIYAVFAGLPNAIGGRAGAYGMYENHNDYSFVVILILPFIYMLWRNEQGLKRKFLLLSMIACVLGILLSLSRGGMLTLVLEGLFFVTIGYQGRGKAFLLFMMLCVGLAGIGYQWAKRAENQGDRYTAADAESSRYELWHIGFNIIKTRPILGVGSRRFAEYASTYGEVSGDNRGKNSHNTYIEIATGTGLTGLLFFFLFAKNLIKSVNAVRKYAENSYLRVLATATYMSFISILVRSLLYAKVLDWGIYTLCAIGVSVVALANTEAMNSQLQAQPAERNA